MIDEIPSKMDFVNRVELSFERPLCRGPTIAIAPTQKSKLAVTNPCAKFPFPPLLEKFFSQKRPNLFNLSSKSKMLPRMAPSTMEIIITKLFSPFKAPESPMYNTQSPTACIMIVLIFSGIPFFRSIPKIAPAIIAKAFTMVPNILNPLLS